MKDGREGVCLTEHGSIHELAHPLHRLGTIRAIADEIRETSVSVNQKCYNYFNGHKRIFPSATRPARVANAGHGPPLDRGSGMKVKLVITLRRVSKCSTIALLDPAAETDTQLGPCDGRVVDTRPKLL